MITYRYPKYSCIGWQALVYAGMRWYAVVCVGMRLLVLPAGPCKLPSELKSWVELMIMNGEKPKKMVVMARCHRA